MLNSFRQILLDEMNEEDLKNLADVAMMDPEMDAEYVYSKLATGEMLPWRLETDKGNSILVVEVKQKKKIRSLYVWYASGKGLVGNGSYVTEVLVEFAKLNNCTSLEAVTTPAYARYLAKVGFEIEHVFIKKELG